MSLEIFPQSIQLLPNDRQLFTARAKDLVPMWSRFNNGFVEPDGSVALSSPSGGPTQFLAAIDSAQHLVGGIGFFEFVTDTQFVANDPPVGIDGQLQWTAFFGSPSSPTQWQYRVTVNLTTVEIRDESNALLATLQHNNAVGDRFRVELNSGFRLFINGVLRHDRTTGFSGGINYPAFFGDVSALRASSGGLPRIPAPRLSGDWRLRPTDRLGNVVQFLAPSHGSITPNGLQVEYFNATIPGPYRLTAKIAVGDQVWKEDGVGGATVSTAGGAWAWSNFIPPTPFSGNLYLRGPSTGSQEAFYYFFGSPNTFQIIPGDVMTCYVWLESANPPQEILLQWQATDSTVLEHRAFWGADLIPAGTLGTPSRRFMGALPPTGQWVRLEVAASLVDLEGRVLNGMSVSFFGPGQAHFDRIGKIPDSLQRAEALITIPPLQILGESPRTLQPGATTRFQTNYHEAQITWSVVSGGGSFSQGEFTAPSTPGTTVVRATASVGNQVADITINVPAVITPNLFAVASSEVVDWDTNIASPTWSSIPAGINTSTGVWTAPSLAGQTVRITAANAQTATRDVLILEKFPFSDFVFPLEVDWLKKILVSESEDGTSFIARIKSRARQAFSWKLTKCSVADLITVRNFWDAHHPGKRFIMENLEEGIRLVVRTDSELGWEFTASGINITGRVKEAV